MCEGRGRGKWSIEIIEVISLKFAKRIKSISGRILKEIEIELGTTELYLQEENERFQELNNRNKFKTS